MKKIIFSSLFVMVSWLPVQTLCNEFKLKDSSFTGALSAGYVFKHDSVFKKVYGLGMANVITADGCYQPWNSWGIGAKVSYWLATGKTTFLKLHTSIQEVPITVYLRGIYDCKNDLRLYASLGGGAVWMQEKSCLAHITTWKGIGEAEVGLFYPLWRRISITSSFRYLFPRQTLGRRKVDVGGFDLRAGLGFSY